MNDAQDHKFIFEWKYAGEIKPQFDFGFGKVIVGFLSPKDKAKNAPYALGLKRIDDALPIGINITDEITVLQPNEHFDTILIFHNADGLDVILGMLNKIRKSMVA